MVICLVKIFDVWQGMNAGLVQTYTRRLCWCSSPTNLHILDLKNIINSTADVNNLKIEYSKITLCVMNK
jgi:hypothetical protein